MRFTSISVQVVVTIDSLANHKLLAYNQYNHIDFKHKKKKLTASAGSRTRVDCLEGNHADRYTTDAFTASVAALPRSVCTTVSLPEL